MRDGFADVLKGIGIAEEVRDFPVVEGGEVQAQPLTRAMLQQQAEEVDAGPADKAVDAGVDTLTPDNPTAAEGRDDQDIGEGVHDAVPACRRAGEDTPTPNKAAELRPELNQTPRHLPAPR